MTCPSPQKPQEGLSAFGRVCWAFGWKTGYDGCPRPLKASRAFLAGWVNGRGCWDRRQEVLREKDRVARMGATPFVPAQVSNSYNTIPGLIVNHRGEAFCRAPVPDGCDRKRGRKGGRLLSLCPGHMKRRQRKQPINVALLTPQEISQQMRERSVNRWASLSVEERKAWSQKCWDSRRANHARNG